MLKYEIREGTCGWAGVDHYPPAGERQLKENIDIHSETNLWMTPNDENQMTSWLTG